MYHVFIKWNETMNQKREKRERVYPMDLRNVIKMTEINDIKMPINIIWGMIKCQKMDPYVKMSENSQVSVPKCPRKNTEF